MHPVRASSLPLPAYLAGIPGLRSQLSFPLDPTRLLIDMVVDNDHVNRPQEIHRGTEDRLRMTDGPLIPGGDPVIHVCAFQPASPRAVRLGAKAPRLVEQ